MLRQGGSAVDAAIATQMVLNLVEPQSSGIGGGAFIVYWNAEKKALTTFDARETAPAAAKPDRFLGADGKPLRFYDAVIGGSRSACRACSAASSCAQGSWQIAVGQAVRPAIELAENGFPISPRLNGLLRSEQHLAKTPVAKAYFYAADGSPKSVGTIFGQQAVADTLRTIAKSVRTPSIPATLPATSSPRFAVPLTPAT